MKLLTLMGHGSPWSNEVALSLQSMGHEIHLLDFATLAKGGMPTNLADVTDTLRRYDSVLLIPRPRSQSLQHLALIRPLRRLARRIRPHLILCLYAGRFALAAYFSACRPYAVYVVGSDVLLAGALQRQLNRITLSAASLVLANGEHLAQQTRIQAPSAKVESLLLGVDVRTAQAPGAPRDPQDLQSPDVLGNLQQ